MAGDSPESSDKEEKQPSTPAVLAVDAVQPEAAALGRTVHGLSWVLVVVATLLSTFLFGLDNTIAANVQPAIILEFGAVTRLPWVSVAFMAGAGSTTLFWGQMYGQCNVKWLYICSLVIFEAGSAVCGAAPNMNALIVGRAICGLGGTGMYTGVLTLLSSLTTEVERATYFGLSGLMWGAGTVLGPIIGGAFTSSSAGWRWAFYINLVIAGICAPVYLLLIPSVSFRPNASLKERFVEVDLLGTVLLAGASVSGLMGISFGGIIYPWGSGQIIALFVVAGVLIIAFFAQQAFTIGTTPERRAFPLQFFRDLSLTIVFILECCASTLTYIPVYFIPLYFQFVRHDSAISSGVKLLPLVTFLVALIVVNGFVMTATGRYMPWFLAGGALSLVGSALLYTTTAGTSDSRVYGYSILIGAGAGCYVQLPFSVVQGLVPPEAIPKAVGFVTFAQLVAPSVMLSIANAIFLNESGRHILRALPELSKGIVNSILAGTGSREFTSLSSSSQSIILSLIVTGLNKAYIVCMSAGALTVILSLFLSRGNLFR